MKKKLTPNGYDTDKSLQYLKNYQEFFSRFEDKEIRLLEIGIDREGSLLLWRDIAERIHEHNSRYKTEETHPLFQR
ncbi:hypothetical protein A3K80_06470 [Candidatus Bathyarchaeota archaeon RBG_13_38_9]|nr:MAG: hypothetical protein A3K80_06470 [Candidatus Bathyarchaeota archaeon RBG_13_38_9]